MSKQNGIKGKTNPLTHPIPVNPVQHLKYATMKMSVLTDGPADSDHEQKSGNDEKSGNDI